VKAAEGEHDRLLWMIADVRRLAEYFHFGQGQVAGSGELDSDISAHLPFQDFDRSGSTGLHPEGHAC
jgi:hypothetical protein